MTLTINLNGNRLPSALTLIFLSYWNATGHRSGTQTEARLDRRKHLTFVVKNFVGAVAFVDGFGLPKALPRNQKLLITVLA